MSNILKPSRSQYIARQRTTNYGASVWIGELTRLTGADKELIWSSVLAIVNPEWGARLQEIKEPNKKDIEILI